MKKYTLISTAFMLIALISVAILDWHVTFFEISLYSVSWCTVCLFAFCGIYNLIFLKLHIISISQIYLIVTFCFTSGNLLVYSLGYEGAFDRLKWFDEAYMILAAKTVIIAICCFQLGILFSSLRHKFALETTKASESQPSNISFILIIGMVLFSLSAIFIAFSYKVVLASLTQGYNDRHLLLIQSDFRFFVILTYCVLPLSNIMIYSGWDKNSLVIPHIMSLFSFLVFLVSGSRGPTLGFLLAILFCLRVKKYRQLSTTKVILLGCIIILLIPTIKHLRDDGAREAYDTIPTMLKGFSEMGQSIQTLSATMMIIPDLENFQYGNRYYRAILRVFPSISKQKVDEKSAGLGAWLMLHIRSHSFGETGGLGYLQISEFYSQFGIWGVICGFLLLGYITTSCNQKCEDGIYDKYGLAMSSFSLFILILWVRADSALIRYIVWGAMAILSSKILDSFRKQKNNV